MRVLIATVGTRGDVQPYLALAIGLKAVGHEVTICTCPKFGTLITERGIGYSHLDEGLLELLDSDLGRSVIEDLNGFSRRWRRWFITAALARQPQDCEPAAQRSFVPLVSISLFGGDESSS